MNSEITNDMKVSISEELLKLSDNHEYYENQLNSRNIASFKFMQQFQGSFGDIASHLKNIIETTKEKIGSYDRSFYNQSDERFTIYESEYLISLLQEKELSLGMSFEEYRKSSPPAWDLILDKTISNRTKLRITNSEKFYQLKNKFDTDFAKIKKQERQLNGDTSLIKIEEFIQLNGAPLLANLLTEKLNRLGFELNSRFSSQTLPVFAKQLNENFFLCCSIRSIEDTFLQPNRGVVNLVFHLRNSKCRKAKVETSPHVKINGYKNFMILFTNEVIPYFESCYSFFESPEEFEQNVDAQIALFQILFGAIEEKVYEALGCSSAHTN